MFCRLEDEPQWRLLLEDPLSLPTHILSGMIKLEISDANSARVPDNSSSFYIREFQMKVEDAREIFRSMLHDGFDMDPHIFLWMERIEDVNTANTSYLTLRYCGQTKNKPWDRHQSDMYNKELRSFMGQFYKTAGMLRPSVLAEAKVYTVVDVSSPTPMTQEEIDIQEQVLITAFGDGVLNTQPGGKDIIQLTKEDKETFATLRTTTSRLLSDTKEAPPVIKQVIRDYASQVRQYVNANPTTTSGRAKHTFTKATADMLCQQGVPRVLVDGSTPLVTLGSDIGDTHDDDTSGFFEAGGRSADVVTTFYNHFAYWEHGLTAPFNRQTTKNLAREHHLPFADCFPGSSNTTMTTRRLVDLLCCT